MKYDIVTFGSATRDVFMLGEKLKAYYDQKFETGKAFCFEIGSKNEVEKIVFSTGGGATNAAATFANMGFNCACVSNVGNDPAGTASIDELQRLGIETKHINVSKKYNTGYSTLISSTSVGGRMVVVFRGASAQFNEIQINKSLQAKWFYVTSLAGNLNFLRKILKLADTKKIKVSFNPGSKELDHGIEKLKPILEKVDVLNLNQEEAAKLTGIKFNKLEDIVKKLLQVIKDGIVIITRGPEGLIVCDGKDCYSSGILPGKVVERTGAGDSFGSGFLSGYIKSASIEYAIQLGSANATSVIKEIGAKNGILTKTQINKIKKIKVRRYQLN